MKHLNKPVAIKVAKIPPFFRIATAIFSVIEWPVGKFSLVGNQPFFDSNKFAWIKTLESHWKDILGELQDVMKNIKNIPTFQEVSPDQQPITQDEHWKTYFLYGYGHKMKTNCAQCPKTTALIEKIPGMKTAFFSILSAGKYIPEHRGPYKGLLRYHLALIVPDKKENCWIRVYDKLTHWELGKSLVFDDSYPHEVWNDTDQQRVVLFVDFVRPLPNWLAIINAWVIDQIAKSRYVLQAKRNLEKWEKN